MRKTFAKAVTWRLIGTAEIFAISFWMTGHVTTAGHTAGIAAIASFLSYIVHELAWNGFFSRVQLAKFGETVALCVIGRSTLTKQVTQVPTAREMLAAFEMTQQSAVDDRNRLRGKLAA